MALNPTFDPDVTSYTVSTTNKTNTLTATPNDASASVEIMVGDKTVASGSAATWEDGENVVTIAVSNGTASTVYTVTVTKN